LQAEHIMTDKVVIVEPDMRVGETIERMHPGGHRILPVVDGRGVVKGILSSASIVAHLLPEYIASGELENVSFVPDIGVLRKHYLKMQCHRVDECMDDSPVLANPDDSLLAITAALVHNNEYQCVLVVDEKKHLLGLITPSDVLRTLRRLKLDETHDA